MAATAERKEYPISMRLPEADVAMIDRAAALRGRTRTDFVRDAAVRAAEEVVMENRLIRMSPEGFADFVNILSRPADAGSRDGGTGQAPRALGTRLHGEAVKLAYLGAGTARPVP